MQSQGGGRSAAGPLPPVAQQLRRLSLEEKAALCSGRDFWHLKPQPRLNIPALLITDGPHGLRKQQAGQAQVDFRSVAATCFPTASASACSWDRELLHAMGVALAEECLQEGVSVLLGPGINIKRSPLCGRNFEYFSEDPLLAGELAASLIQGIQSRGVGASLKHYAVNNQEYRRATIDVRVDERTLHELYLAGFEHAVRRARPWTVMCAYNQVNGRYCSEHGQLLNDILRGDWGFDGVVVSDWGACNDRVEGLRAGLDLEMPGSGGVNDRRIAAAVRSGALDEAVLDRSVERVLRLMSRATASLRPGYRCDRESHHALARRIAAASVVVLQNRSELLPLRASMRIAVLGRFARRPRFQGAGSSQITPWRLDTAWDELQRQAECDYAPAYPEDPEQLDEALLAEACELAAEADVAVIFAGLPGICESEALDREHMALPASQDTLIRKVAALQPRTVVVLSCGAPVELPWADQVAAIVAGYLGGQAGGPALVDVLLGHINPSGKLAETWPLRLEHTPAHAHFPGGPATVEYREALYVGYRYYDALAAQGLEPGVRFPFGHGLSYTRFDYAGLHLSASHVRETDTLTVTVRITNSGAVAGSEIVQLYVRDSESTLFRPDKELKGFQKIRLEPGQSGDVRFELDRRAFAFYNADRGSWQVESGHFEILIGASSTDIRCRGGVWVESSQPERRIAASADAAALYYRPPARSEDFDQAAFRALCGDSQHATAADRSAGAFHLNSTLGELSGTLIGRLLYRAALRAATRSAGGGEHATLEAMMRRVVEDMPLRQVVLFSNGRLSFALADVLLALMNRRYRAALRGLLGRRVVG